MMYSHCCLAMSLIPVSRALGNDIGIFRHAKKESLIWTIKTHLSEVCQQDSLKILLNVDTALEFFHHKLLSSTCIGFNDYMLF